MKTIVKKAFVSSLAVAGIASGAQLVAAPAANAVGNWGAIAVSSNGSNGRSWDYASRADAERAALNSCPGACKVLTTFVNSCGAVAQNRRSFHGGSGPTLYAAQRNAITLNGGGSILAWVCTSR